MPAVLLIYLASARAKLPVAVTPSLSTLAVYAEQRPRVRTAVNGAMLSSSFRLPAASGTARRETNAPAVPCNSSAHRGSVHACGAQRPVASGIACNVPSLVSRTSVVTHAATLDRPSSAASGSGQKPVKQPLKVLIAGAGISGLALALALIKKGVEVTVFERDLTAIRGEGKYRGPIQVRPAIGMRHHSFPLSKHDVITDFATSSGRLVAWPNGCAQGAHNLAVVISCSTACSGL